MQNQEERKLPDIKTLPASHQSKPHTIFWRKWERNGEWSQEDNVSAEQGKHQAVIAEYWQAITVNISTIVVITPTVQLLASGFTSVITCDCP